MSKQRRKDTQPEVLLRRELFARGLRYRVHLPVPTLPRRSIDIAFPACWLAVFVDGCFWHGCPMHATAPAANATWWAAKLDRNRTRDLETDHALRGLGWEVERVWEHETPVQAAVRVEEVVRARRGGRRSR